MKLVPINLSLFLSLSLSHLNFSLSSEFLPVSPISISFSVCLLPPPSLSFSLSSSHLSFSLSHLNFSVSPISISLSVCLSLSLSNINFYLSLQYILLSPVSISVCLFFSNINFYLSLQSIFLSPLSISVSASNHLSLSPLSLRPEKGRLKFSQVSPNHPKQRDPADRGYCGVCYGR